MMKDLFNWRENERTRLVDRYLTQLQNCLSGFIYYDPPLQVLDAKVFDPALRKYGWDWPSVAYTMIVETHLASVRMLSKMILEAGVPRDFTVTGVLRGGASIMMRRVLDAWSEVTKNVLLADSFEGLPPPDEDKYPADKGDKFYTYSELSVSMEQVQANFRKYGLLDDRVKFFKGWFKDTLSSALLKTSFITLRRRYVRIHYGCASGFVRQSLR